MSVQAVGLVLASVVLAALRSWTPRTMSVIPQTMAQMPMIQMMLTRPAPGRMSTRMPNNIASAPPMMPQTHPLLGMAHVGPMP